MRLKLAAAFILAAGLAGPAYAGDSTTISTGDKVDLKAHLAKGKYTLFEFTANW